MVLLRSLQKIYSLTIDHAKFRETASRLVVFILPLFYWGRSIQWLGLCFVGAGLLLRAWAAGHLQKDQSMAFSGPYQFVRHPLYLGSCLLALGFIVALHHWFVTIAIGGVTLLTYWHTIRHEEKNLQKRYGEAYLEYARKVRALWPTFKNVSKTNSDMRHFSFQQYFRNKEYECGLGVFIVLLILFLGSS